MYFWDLWDPLEASREQWPETFQEGWNSDHGNLYPEKRHCGGNPHPETFQSFWSMPAHVYQ